MIYEVVTVVQDTIRVLSWSYVREWTAIESESSLLIETIMSCFRQIRLNDDGGTDHVVHTYFQTVFYCVLSERFTIGIDNQRDCRSEGN
jgi:hypothetical protein